MRDENTATILDLAVIGGGPAGYFAAIRCAEKAKSAGQAKRVLIIERARKSLGKVLASGGGRCNVTHACFEPARLVTFYPRGGDELRGPFSRFQPRDTAAWFEQRGVRLKTEDDGRMFPVTDSSRTIADCLEQSAERAGVEVWNQVALLGVKRLAGGGPRFALRVQDNVSGMERDLLADSVLFASGSEAYCHELIGGLGHDIVPPVPSLFTFNVVDARIADLAGISVPQACVSVDEEISSKKVEIRPQTGPLLVTHWGFSGPAVLKLSAWGARWLHERGYRCKIKINWLHPLSSERVLDELMGLKNLPDNHRKKAALHAAYPQISIRLWKRLCEAAGIHETLNWADVSKSPLRALAAELTAGVYQVNGKGTFKDEFVTCGGVRLDEVDFKSMQSRLVPGLYFAGEVLDIDGLTGGFNFQNAWTTGWLVGEAV